MTTTPEPAAPADNGLVFLHASGLGDYSPALTLGRGWPSEITMKVGTEDRSIPVTYLDKDLIEEGQYVHPKTGRAVNASRAQIKDWVDKFHRMAGEGIEFGIPTDHRMKSADNLGYVKDAKLVDVGGKTRLRLTHALIGEDAAMLAVKNRASLGIDPDYIDAKGRKWGSVIIHSSITPDPVIFGMGSFTPTFLSRGQEREAQMLFLSAQDAITTPTKETVMPLTPELRKRFAALTGEKEDTAEDVLLSRVAEEIDKLNDDLLAPIELARSEFAGQIQELTRERDEARQTIVTLSRQSEPNEEVLYERSLRVGGIVDQLLDQGMIPAAVNEFKEIALGTADAPNVIALSRTGTGAGDCLAARVAHWALKYMAKPGPGTGSRTGVQHLSRSANPAKDSAATEADKPRPNPWLEPSAYQNAIAEGA